MRWRCVTQQKMGLSVENQDVHPELMGRRAMIFVVLGNQHHKAGRELGPESWNDPTERNASFKVECIERMQRLAHRTGNWHNKGSHRAACMGVQGLRGEKRRRRRAQQSVRDDGGWRAKKWLLGNDRKHKAARQHCCRARQGGHPPTTHPQRAPAVRLHRLVGTMKECRQRGRSGRGSGALGAQRVSSARALRGRGRA